uniref:Uncharacterized protein n=1 Tax=Anopheles atroparvus TaxID=41427 RepID=A0A182J7X6_ANOAO
MTVGDQPVLGDQMARLEEVRNGYYPVKQGDGYGGNAFQQDSRDWKRFATVDVRMPRHQDTSKSRGQHGPYGKSSHVNKNSLIVNGYERKKTSRATQYAQYDEVASKTAPPTYNGVPSSWEQHLLIGCNSNVAKHTGQVDGSYGASGGYYYPMELMYHDASFSQYDSPYPSPVYHGYEQNPSGYYPPPPPPPANSIPPVPADHSNLLEGTEFVPDTYYQPPSDFYGAPQPAFYPGYEMYPTEYYPSAPHAPPAPMEGGPAYNTAVDEQVPRFAAPVQEKLMESPKAPVISAFRKPASPAGSNTTATAGPGKATGNGTVVDQATTASTPNPMPVLTTTLKPNENDDAFWSVESNPESTTDTVEDSTTL